MKKILTTLVALALIISVFVPTNIKAATTITIHYCGNTPETSNYDSEVPVIYSGATFSIAVVTSDNSIWTATTDATWISCSKSSGQASNPVVTLTAATNPTNESRTGHVYFTAGDVEATYTIVQDANPVIAAGVTNVTFKGPEYPATSKSVTYEATTVILVPITTEYISWSIDTDVSWLTLSRSEGINSDPYTRVSVAKNTTNVSRTGHVIVTADGEKNVFTIYQAANPNGEDVEVYPFTGTPTGYTVFTHGQSFVVSIFPTVDWKVTSNDSHITIDASYPTSGSAGVRNAIKVNCAANTAGSSGTITISGGGMSQNIAFHWYN